MRTTTDVARQISDAQFEPVVLEAPLRDGEIGARLARAARRGLLPGYRAQGDHAFRVEADAVPFPHELTGRVERGSGDVSVVRLELRRMARMPLVFAAVIGLTIWPGVWLTDSLLGTYWPAYGRWSAEMPWLTYAWYLPITVLPLPWMWRTMSRKSLAMARESAEKQALVIASELDAAGAAPPQ